MKNVKKANIQKQAIKISYTVIKNNYGVRDLCTAPRIISLSPLSLATLATDATLGASGLWLGTRTGAGGTATLTEGFFGRSPWLHGQQDGLIV